MTLSKVEVGRAQVRTVAGRHVPADPAGHCVTHCPGCDREWSIAAFLRYVEALEARVGGDAAVLAADEPEIGGAPC